MGATRRYRSTGEHGKVYGQQLLDPWLLEELAPLLQSLDSAVWLSEYLINCG